MPASVNDMHGQPIATKIQEHLKDASTRQHLKDRFASAREQLTTSIGEAAKLANVSPEKARYAEAIGILSPGRSDGSRGVNTAAHRRYSLGELNRLIVMGNLIDNGFSMADIAEYLKRERASVDKLVKSLQVSNATTRLHDAETSYRQRMLIPRLLYFAQCLLLGDVVDCSMAIVLPVEPGNSDGADEHDTSDAQDDMYAPDTLAAPPVSAPPITISSVEDLPQIGPSLVGWRLRSHPYCVLYMPAPRMDDETRYELRSIDAMCRDAGVDVDAYPTGAYLLIEREFAGRYLFADPTSRPRMDPETIGTDKDKPQPNPRAVAHRLLRMLRQRADEKQHLFGHNYTTDGDGMIYNSPEFSGDLNGNRLLTAITDLVVQLGNAPEARPKANPEASPEASNAPSRARWLFSAILMPDDSSLPVSWQSLVVTMQSELSPHTVGATRLSPGGNAGLSTAAALSGHMLLRQVMDSTDAAIVNAGVEGEPGPALALPIQSVYRRMLAVLYVRSTASESVTVDDTFTADDQLLLRIIGHIIGGIVFSFQGSLLTGNMLTDMIAQPRNVDRFFQEFPTANAFWAHLETALQKRIDAARERPQIQRQTQDASAVTPFTLLAVDMDGYTNVLNTYGANTARHLVRAVGNRIAQKIKLTTIPVLSPRRRATLYYIYGDRFYLLLDNMGLEEAKTYATDLQKQLIDNYTIEVTRTNGSRAISAGAITIANVRVRMVFISYEGKQLSRLVKSPADESSSATQARNPVQNLIYGITDALDAGIIQAKQTAPDAILYLDVEKTLFQRLYAPDGEQRPAPTETRPPESAVNGVGPTWDNRDGWGSSK